MGVDYTTIVMYGAKFEYTPELAALLEQYDDPDAPLFACIDHMNGEYIVFGEVLAIPDNEDGNDFSLFEGPVPVNRYAASEREALIDSIQRITCEDTNPGYWVIGYYS